jgi:hypothetical protein
MMLISCSRRPNIYFNITSPTPGTFIIALHYKGREKAILEMDLKIDDLLEKVIIHTQDPSRNQLLNFLLTAKRQQTPPGPGIRSVERSKGLRPSQKGLRQTIIPFIFHHYPFFISYLVVPRVICIPSVFSIICSLTSLRMYYLM